jgi:hypothetical protein
MDYLSESTKKEKRNLLAAGFAGIIIARLQIYPTEIDLVGLKFQSPDLPLVAVGGLCAATVYFWLKFFSSYLYERSSALRTTLATQITEGATSMDIAREEEGLELEGQAIIQHQKIIQGQQENGARLIKNLQDKIDQEVIAHEASTKITDKEISELEEVLASNAVPTPDCVLPDRRTTEKQLHVLKESQKSYLRQREMKQQQDMDNLENEKNAKEELYRAQVKDLRNKEKAFRDKREHIIEWKKVHKFVGKVSLLHLFLEIYLPLLVGVASIASLIYLMFHFSPPPQPPSMPEV